MDELIKNKKCVFVVGPTGSGKSKWALEQAQKYNGSVVNIDSVQFYKGLEVGSAAPTVAERKAVPHYLYAFVEPPEEMTAGKYIDLFHELVKTDVQFPLFITGGTGFYIQALEKGMFDVEPIPHEIRSQIESELSARGAEALHTELLMKDPASKIHLNDHFRIVRALEIIRHTGKIPSDMKTAQTDNKNKFPFPYIKVGFDFEKAVFQKRIELRTEKMLNEGMIEEVKKVISDGFSHWAPLQSVGIREVVQYLQEQKTRSWLVEAINRSNLQLIKKQKTWFKRDQAVLWSMQSERLAEFL